MRAEFFDIGVPSKVSCRQQKAGRMRRNGVQSIGRLAAINAECDNQSSILQRAASHAGARNKDGPWE
jgi:hypothetical protein